MFDKNKAGPHAKKGSAQALVQLRVHDLGQLFNLMDPSPFIDRDLDADAEAFIEGWALEFPVSKPITLMVHLEQAPTIGGADPRRFTELAVRNFFLAKANSTRRELRELLNIGQISLVIGMAFMALCLTLSKIIAREFPVSTTAEWLKEGLAVGCWVAMWKPIDIYLYGWWPVLRRLRIYRKMSRLRVELKIKETAGMIPWPGP